MSEDEQINILKASIGIAIGVAVFDYGFRAIRRAIRKSKIDRANREMVHPITIEEIDEPAVPTADTDPAPGRSGEDSSLGANSSRDANSSQDANSPQDGTSDPAETSPDGPQDGSIRDEPALQGGD